MFSDVHHCIGQFIKGGMHNTASCMIREMFSLDSRPLFKGLESRLGNFLHCISLQLQFSNFIYTPLRLHYRVKAMQRSPISLPACRDPTTS